MISRYALILASVGPVSEKSSCGSAAVPRALRLLFTDALMTIHDGGRGTDQEKMEEAVKSGNGLSLDIAHETAAMLEASDIDLMDVLLSRATQWGAPDIGAYFEMVDVEGFVRGAPGALIEAAPRVGAEGRALITASLGKWRKVDDPRFLDLVADLADDSSKAVREAAASGLPQIAPARLLPACARRLSGGNADNTIMPAVRPRCSL